MLLGGGALGVAIVGGAYVLVEQDILPGRIRLDALLADLPVVGDEPVPVPDAATGPMASGSFRSRARGTKVGWTVAYPPGFAADAELPVCLLLHGRYEDHRWPFDELHLDSYLGAAVQDDGLAPFALASIDGGSATNWHPRASGDDPQAMLVHEYLPLLARRGLRIDRIGLWGWSLGGYGSLLLASELGAQRVAALVAASPALWLAAEDTAPDVFDDAEDFVRNDVFSRTGNLEGIPIRIDIGEDDSFTSNVEEFISALPTPPAGGVTSGFHDTDYWRKVAPQQIAFIGNHLDT